MISVFTIINNISSDFSRAEEQGYADFHESEDINEFNISHSYPRADFRYIIDRLIKHYHLKSNKPFGILDSMNRQSALHYLKGVITFEKEHKGTDSIAIYVLENIRAANPIRMLF